MSDDLTIELPAWNAKQVEFMEAAQKYVLLLGAAGSGKSLALCWRGILTALEYPGSTGVVARANYPSLRDTTKRTFLEEAMPPELMALCDEIKSEGREALILPNGSKVLFRCFDSPTKLGSQQFDWIICDEVVEIEERIFLTLIARLRGQIGPRRLWAATNPPDTDSYLHRYFVEEPERTPALQADRLVIHSSTYDNAANLPADYIKELETYPAAWRERFLYGRWGFLVDGKPVFDGFDPQIHMGEPRFVPGRTLVRGWDFGRRHPACVWLQTREDGGVNVLHELLGTDIELRDFAKQVQEITQREFGGTRNVEDYCDVAGTQKNDRGPTSVQILRNEFGINPFYRKYGIVQSVERISYLLRTPVGRKEPLLSLHVRCRWLRKAFAGGYHMDARTDLPAKNGIYDDCMDALRYGVCGVTQPVGARVDPAWNSIRDKWRLAV